MRAAALTTAVALALAGPVGAAVDGAAGTAGGAAFAVGGGARALGMGGSGAAAAGDPEAVWLNPARLAAQEGIGAGSFLHGAYFTDIAVDQLALAVPTRWGIFGGAYGSLRMGDIEVIDRNGGGSGAILSPADWTAAGAWAGRRGALAAGAALWYLSSELAPDAKAASWSGDLGAAWTPVPALTLGAAVQHLGAKLAYGSEAAALPLTVRGGGAWRAGAAGLMLALDAVKPADGALGVRLGAEERAVIAKGWAISARGGWRTGAPGSGSLAGLSAGAGVDWRPRVATGARDDVRAGEPYERYGVSGVRVDYAWTPLGELGQAHWFGFGLGF